MPSPESIIFDHGDPITNVTIRTVHKSGKEQTIESDSERAEIGFGMEQRGDRNWVWMIRMSSAGLTSETWTITVKEPPVPTLWAVYNQKGQFVNTFTREDAARYRAEREGLTVIKMTPEGK